MEMNNKAKKTYLNVESFVYFSILELEKAIKNNDIDLAKWILPFAINKLKEYQMMGTRYNVMYENIKKIINLTIEDNNLEIFKILFENDYINKFISPDFDNIIHEALDKNNKGLICFLVNYAKKNKIDLTWILAIYPELWHKILSCY